VAEPKGTFKVRLDVPIRHHAALRRLAAQHERSMASLARDILVAAIEGRLELKLPPPPRPKAARDEEGPKPRGHKPKGGKKGGGE
jgi:plasmid stability protein